MSEPKDHANSRRLKKLRVCRVRGRSDYCYLLRLFKHKARVLPVDQPNGEGLLVDRADLYQIGDPEYRQGLFPEAEPETPDEGERKPSTPKEIAVETALLPLPYGLLDLDNTIVTDPGPPPRVRCYVRGCTHLVRPPTRGERGELCPDHKIYCHHSSSVTLTFADPRRNLIAAPNLFARRVRGNPHKVESHRFGFLNSEDAVSWNVFRSLQEAHALHLVVQWVTGRDVAEEPQLFLWGLSSSDDRFEPWPLLTEARRRFEVNKLPVARPLTEPDIALWSAGKVLILIEAKLLSKNPIVYRGQPRTTPQSLTMDEIFKIYDDPRLRYLDPEKVRAVEWTTPQLYRNLVFADFLSHLDSPNTEGYLVNLVRAGEEHHTTSHFRQLLRPEYTDRFTRMTWETIYVLTGSAWRRLSRLQEYLLTKAVGTANGFLPAFRIDAW